MFRGLGRSIAFASAGFLGGYGLTAAIGGAVNELRDSIRVSAQTVQALRSTGSVAGTSAREIDKLANALLRKTGVDDEAIKTSANLLLTFTQVRNEAGRGNDIFDQSVKAIVDMSAVIGDLSSNSIQLGKALNDPVAGMTALRRVGVSFTQQQREQIKALMEHGRILDAQKIILREVQREFGGQAAAQEKATGGLNTLRETIKNTSAELLRGLMPSFREMVSSLQKQVDWLTHTREGQKKLKSVADALKQAVDAIVASLKLMLAGIKFVNGITGSFKRTMELLIALKVVSVLAGWRRGFLLLAGAEGIAGATASISGKAGLYPWLMKLKGIGPLTISVAVVYEVIKKGSNWIERNVPGAGFVDKYLGGAWLNRQLGFGGPSGTGAAAPTDPKGFTRTPGRQAGAGVVGTAMAAAQSPGAAAASFHLPGERTPWDCSAFTQAVFRKSGISIGSTTYTQFAGGRKVNRNQLQPGDLVFFNYPGERSPGHVGIFVGGGMMVHDHGQSRGVSYQAVDWGHYVGARCYIKGHVHVGATSAGSAPTFTPHDAAALSTPATATTKSKGATPATLISVRAGIDAQLALFKGLTPAIRAQLSPLGLEAEKHLEQLRAHLRKGMSATDLAKTRAGIARWGKVLRDEIAKAKTAAEKIAREAADAAALAFDRQFRDASTGVFRIFDRDTDRYVKNFQRDTEKAIAGMRKAFDKQMQAFDAETARGLQRFVVPQTGAEGALAAFQASRQAEADAKAMADAQASGDPEQVRQLQLDLQERALEAAAKQSREAQDRATEDQQRAYQQQRDDQRGALQEAEDERERAYQEQREATLATYQQLREDQRTHLEDDLEDWQTWIAGKKKTWAAFLAWLATRGFAVPSGWDTHVDDDQIQRNLFGIGASDIPKPGAGRSAAFARGGRVPGLFVGREDTVLARVSPGETVIDRSLTAALERMVAGGGIGGGLTISFDGATFVGAPNRQVTDAWARDMQDALDRLVGYRNPLT